MRFAAFVCLLCTSLAGQTLVPRDFARQHLHLWKSPFERPKQTAKIAAPLAAVTLVLMKFDQPAINHYAQQPAPWAVKTSRAGDALTLASSGAALLAIGQLAGKPTITQMGASSLTALSHSLLVTQGLKSISRRQRPDGSNHWSLPSGHAMTSFAMAAAISSHPKAPRWLKIAAPVAASAIAFSRVGARKHYPTDIVVGSSIGWFIGRSLRYR